MIVDDFVEDVNQIIGRTTSRKDHQFPGASKFGLGTLAAVNSPKIHAEETTHHRGTFRPSDLKTRLGLLHARFIGLFLEENVPYWINTSYRHRSPTDGMRRMTIGLQGEALPGAGWIKVEN